MHFKSSMQIRNYLRVFFAVRALVVKERKLVMFLAKFIVDTLREDDFLSKTRARYSALRWQTAFGAMVVGSLLFAAPELFADWYRQAIFSYSEPIGWLYGFWGVLPLSAFFLGAANAVATIDGVFERRYAQSRQLTRHGIPDETFAELMGGADVSEKLANGKPERSLIRGIVSGLLFSSKAGLLLCPILLAPAAILSAFFPDLTAPAFVATVVVAAVVYMAYYSRNLGIVAFYFIIINIPLFAVFAIDGLVAFMATHFSLYLFSAIGGYVMAKIFAAQYGAK